MFALVDVPYAAGRRYLAAGQPPPTAVDDLVTEACRCILSAASEPPTGRGESGAGRWAPAPRRNRRTGT